MHAGCSGNEANLANFRKKQRMASKVLSTRMDEARVRMGSALNRVGRRCQATMNDSRRRCQETMGKRKPSVVVAEASAVPPPTAVVVAEASVTTTTVEAAAPLVLDHLEAGTDDEKEAAALALRNMSSNDANDACLIADAIPRLATLLETGTAKAKEDAAGALWHLSANPENTIFIAQAGAIPALVELLKQGTHPTAVLFALLILSNLSYRNGTNLVFSRITDAGAIPTLVLLLENKQVTETAIATAAEVLAHLSRNNASNARCITMTGAIPPLVRLLKSDSDTLQEHAAGVLANLAANDEGLIKAAGGIPPLKTLLSTGSDIAKEAAATALARTGP